MFEHMRTRTQSGVSIVLMAIRCHGEIADSTLRSLLRVARSTMRSVDRIGSTENSTLLICMPSVDEEMAIQRGRQICRSAEAIGLRWKGVGPRPVSIGIVQAGGSETFSAIVSRSIELADQASDLVFGSDLHRAQRVCGLSFLASASCSALGCMERVKLQDAEFLNSALNSP